MPYVSQYGPSIAEGIREEGRILAEQARARGQIYGNLATNLGQIGQQTFRDLAAAKDPKRAAEIEDIRGQAELRKAQMGDYAAQAKQREQGVIDDKMIDDLLSQGGDLDTITENLRKGGHGHLVPKVQKQFDDANNIKAQMDERRAQAEKYRADAAKIDQEVADKKKDYIGGLSASVKEHGYDPAAFHNAVALAYKHGELDKETAAKTIAMAIQNPEQIQPFVDANIAASPEQRKNAATRAEKAAEAGEKTKPVSTVEDTDALKAYADKLGKPVDQLTAGERVKARGEAKGEMESPDAKAQRQVLIDLERERLKTARDTNAAGAGVADVDAERPDPTTANKIDPKTGQTPNAIYQNAVSWALTGNLPAFGMGSAPPVRNARNAIQNKGAAIAASVGVDLPTLRAEYKAKSGTLSKLMPQYTATATASRTATDNLDLAVNQSDVVGRTDSALANRYLQWAQGNLTSATGLTQFETYVYTAAREYAKVTSGGAASAQGLTDSASREASKLLNTAKSKDAFKAAVGAMKNDMGNVIKNQTQTLAGVSEDIAKFLAVSHGVDPLLATAPSTTPVNGSQAQTFSVTLPNGKQKVFPSQKALDDFKREAGLK